MTEIMAGKETAREPRFIGVSADGPHIAKGGIHEGSDYFAIRGEQQEPMMDDSGIHAPQDKQYYAYSDVKDDKGLTFMDRVVARIKKDHGINVY